MVRVISRVLSGSLATLLLASTASAQLDPGDPEFIPEESAVFDAEDPEGLSGTASLSATFQALSNRDVIGQTNGGTFNFGLSFDGTLDWVKGPHELQNTLTINEAFTRTPNIDEWLRTTDSLRAESIYYYHVPSVPWFGPFARVQFDTSLIAGVDVRESNVRYAVTDQGGDTEFLNRSRLKLTNNLAPSILRESFGIFARPIAEPAFDVDLRSGFGARQVFADGNFFINDDGDTADIEVEELRSYSQAGAEFAAVISGELEEGKVTYLTSFEVMAPFINELEEDDDRSVGELTNYEYLFNLSFKLVEWASLDYEFRALKVPQLLDEWQLSNNLLLTFTYTIARPRTDEDEE